MEWSKEGQPALEQELKRKGADIIRFAELSGLSEKINRGFGKAILIGILLSKEYVFSLYKAIQTGSNEFDKKNTGRMNWPNGLPGIFLRLCFLHVHGPNGCSN
jgi:hypothetical protein